MKPLLVPWLPLAALLAGAVPIAAADAQPAAPRSLDDTQDGRARWVGVGEVLEIRLSFDSGTGFAWVPEEGAAQVTSVGIVAQPPWSERTVVRRVQSQVFHFRAAAPGRYPLSFSLGRQRNDDDEIDRVVRFVIRVRQRRLDRHGRAS